MEASCLRVSDLVLAPLVRVSPHLPLGEAARLLAATGVGTLVVDTEPLTELTEHDVVRAVALGSDGATEVVGLVHNLPEFVGYDTPVEFVAAMLLDNGRRGVVVVDDEGRPGGVLTLPTVITAILGRASWVGALRIALQVDRRV